MKGVCEMRASIPEGTVEEVSSEHRAGGEVVVHRVHLHLDGRGFVSEKEAAHYLRRSRKTLVRMRHEGYWEPGTEVRCIRGEWRYSLSGLDRYHDEQGAPTAWG